MTPQDKREERLKLLDDDIGRALRDSEARGELRAAPSYGRPFALDDGYEATPVELRLGFKILKNAGVLPPEVEWMREITALQQRLDACDHEAEALVLRRQIAEHRQQLALRLEKLRRTGEL